MQCKRHANNDSAFRKLSRYTTTKPGFWNWNTCLDLICYSHINTKYKLLPIGTVFTARHELYNLGAWNVKQAIFIKKINELTPYLMQNKYSLFLLCGHIVKMNFFFLPYYKADLIYNCFGQVRLLFEGINHNMSWFI